MVATRLIGIYTDPEQSIVDYIAQSVVEAVGAVNVRTHIEPDHYGNVWFECGDLHGDLRGLQVMTASVPFHLRQEINLLEWLGMFPASIMRVYDCQYGHMHDVLHNTEQQYALCDLVDQHERATTNKNND